MKNLIQLVAAMQLPEDRGNGMSHGTIVASNDSRFSAGNASVELTQFSQALVDSAQLERELEIVAPSVPAARKFTWRKHDDAADFQTEGDDVRAIGAPFKQVKSTGTEENGRTLNKGLTVILDNDEMLPGDEERWAGRLTRRIFRNDLVRAYAGLISAATPSALVWNGKSAPDADVAKLLFQGGEERGLASNSVVYGGAAWLYRFLAYSDAARQNGGAAAALTPEQLAMLLMVDSVLVSKAYKQSTASAKAAVLGSYVLAYHAQANASPDDPSNIKRFVTPVEGGGKVRVYVKREDKTTAVTVEHYSNIIVTSTKGIRVATITQAAQQG